VLGVPIETKSLKGLDSLFVDCADAGRHSCCDNSPSAQAAAKKHAALFALSLLALDSASLDKKL